MSRGEGGNARGEAVCMGHGSAWKMPRSEGTDLPKSNAGITNVTASGFVKMPSVRPCPGWSTSTLPVTGPTLPRWGRSWPPAG